MKTLINITLSATFLLASCASGYYATSGNYDDAYYTPSGKKSAEATVTGQQAQTSAPVDHEALNPERVGQTSALSGEQNAT